MPLVNSSPELLREQHGDEAVVEVRPTIDFSWLGINAQHPALQDKRLRRAIQQAIDLEAIMTVTYEGMGVSPATGFAAPGVIGHRESKLYGYDPDAARALIKEAGLEGHTVEIQHANYR